MPSALEAALDNLRIPVNPSADPAMAAVELDMACQCILTEALEVTAAQRQLEATLREYNFAHGFTPSNDQPGCRDDVRRRGGDLGEEMAHGSQHLARHAIVQPTYSSPVKNMRKAEAAAAELGNLEGEALRRHQQRLQELLATVNR